MRKNAIQKSTHGAQRGANMTWETSIRTCHAEQHVPKRNVFPAPGAATTALSGVRGFDSNDSISSCASTLTKSDWRVESRLKRVGKSCFANGLRVLCRIEKSGCLDKRSRIHSIGVCLAVGEAAIEAVREIRVDGED